MEEDFDRLQKLLTLKRYEQPPPGYFYSFSSKVMARIEAKEMADSLTWWQKLGLDLNVRPALVCGLGVLVCGLLSAGLITSLFQGTDQPLNDFVMTERAISSPAFAGAFVSVSGDQVPSSTQPVFSASRFDGFGTRVGRTSYRFGNPQ